MKKPAVGMVVWFWRGGCNAPEKPSELIDQPEAGTIVYVHSDTVVNLLVAGHGGLPRAELSVTLRQSADAQACPFCEFVPS